METLRIAGFTSQAWMTRAIEELTALGLEARPAAAGSRCGFAIVVTGRPEQLEPLRALALAAELEEGDEVAAEFRWSEYVNRVVRSPR